MDKKQIEIKPTIKDLYPHLSEEQQREAEEILEEYLEVVLEIFEYVENNQIKYHNDV